MECIVSFLFSCLVLSPVYTRCARVALIWALWWNWLSKKILWDFWNQSLKWLRLWFSLKLSQKLLYWYCIKFITIICRNMDEWCAFSPIFLVYTTTKVLMPFDVTDESTFNYIFILFLYLLSGGPALFWQLFWFEEWHFHLW